MGQPKRRTTRQGIGAGRGSGVVSRDGEPDDAKPLSMRDTLPAPAVDGAVPVSAPPPSAPFTMQPETATGTRRRATLGIESLDPNRPDTIEGMPKITLDAIPVAPKSSPSERKRREVREALRVDEVRAQKITLRGAAESRPRVVDTKRIARAPIESRDAFVIQLIDGTLTMTELSDASGIAEPELDRIVARLIRLGIVAM
jgi:hypothetical protein